MKDYYTLIEILITLNKNNKELKNFLSYLNVILKFKKGINSLDYDFDYFVDNGVYLKCIRNEISGFDTIVYGLKNQNECLVIQDENNNYNLENKNIATLNPVYQEHFNETISLVINSEFLNNYFFESDLIYNEKQYHLIIAPTGLYVTRKNEDKIDLELAFNAKSGIVNLKSKKEVYKPLSIFKMRIPKSILTDQMVDMTDRSLGGLDEQDLTSYFLSEINSGDSNLSFYLQDNGNRYLIKKM